MSSTHFSNNLHRRPHGIAIRLIQLTQHRSTSIGTNHLRLLNHRPTITTIITGTNRRRNTQSITRTRSLLYHNASHAIRRLKCTRTNVQGTHLSNLSILGIRCELRTRSLSIHSTLRLISSKTHLPGKLYGLTTKVSLLNGPQDHLNHHNRNINGNRLAHRQRQSNRKRRTLLTHRLHGATAGLRT